MKKKSFQVITGAGHHVFADKPELFNRFVNEACALSDSDSLAAKAQIAENQKSQTDVDDDEEVCDASTETTIKEDTKGFVKTST